MSDEPKEHRSILETLADRTGVSPKVLLPDSDSEHGASPVVAPNSPEAKLVPQGRGNYQMMGQIARGGMSVILKGHDTDLGRDVAVKVLEPELAKRPEVVQRFVEEAQIGGQLQHPGIVPVYELGMMDDDRPYFTMKLIKGRTLASLFQARKFTSDDRGRLLSIFESVCQTVAYAHSKGVLHRDLKPANIMVGAFREVQVVDWGLAKVLQRGGVADEKRAQETRASLHTIIETVRSGPGSVGSDSMVGSVMGTPAYMAPEQAQGEVEKLDERADVFSLGAILCELLTGLPPYVESDGEHIIAQAARALLDPAKERIEACGADSALIQLCLSCLTPSRAARPANADEVAQAIHTYLTSTEERAQKAELEAVESRLKAASERRARRMTLALGAAILIAIVVGGGSYGWVQKTRSERIEQTQVAVDEAHGASIQLLQLGKPKEALAEARRALSLAETGSASASLLERAQHFVEQAEKDVEAAEAERELLAQDERLRTRLVDLRLEQVDTLGNRELEIELDAKFAQAFMDFGVDLQGVDLVPALTRIRERDVAEEVALALDDWARLRRIIFGTSSVEAENLFYLAMDLDPDPVRMEMREAIVSRDKATMLALAEPERLDRLPAGSIWVLGSALWSMYPEERAAVYRMYDRALPLHPDDYVLQSIGGRIYNLVGRYESALACRTAALSQRPDDITAHLGRAEALLFLGRLTECEFASRACIAKDPDSFTGHYLLSMSLLQLGHYEKALRSLERSLEIKDNPDVRSDLIVNRYFLGLEDKETFVQELSFSVLPHIIGTLAFGLLEHPNPDLRDSELVLRRMEEAQATLADQNWVWMLRMMAHMDLGDWEAAEIEMSGQYERPSLAFFAPPVLTFMRAIVYANLDSKDAALECFERGLSEAQDLIGSDEDGWRRSDLVRWREKARVALGL